MNVDSDGKKRALCWGNCPKSSKQQVQLSFNFTACFDLNKYIDKAWKLRIDQNSFKGNMPVHWLVQKSL